MTIKAIRRLASLSILTLLLSPLPAAAGAMKTAVGEGGAAPIQGPAGINIGRSALGSPSASLSAPGLTTAPSALAPSVAAPSVKVPLAAAPQAEKPVAPMVQLSQEVSAEITALQKPDIGSESASSGGQRIEDIITGRRSVSGSGEVSVGVLAAPAEANPSGLQPAAPGKSVEKSAAKPSAPASAQAVKPVEGRFAYGLKRRLLAALASVFGVSASLPPAGPQLAAAVVAEAGRKRVVFSDFDDTLGPYNSVLTPEMAAALAAVRQSGKQVAVITDRTDKAGGHQLSAFESLATIPAEARAGMYVAAVSGGKVYRYDDKGEPVLAWEYPPLDESRRQPIKEAIAALKAQLPGLGTSQHPGDAKNPAESWQPYSYAMMLAVGTPEPAIKKAARLFEEELKKRGFDVFVNARVPKDPANPPYIQFSVVDKSASVGTIAKALGLEPWEALALGDNMYVPRSPETPGRLARLAQRVAERLSGRPLPFTGNETDRNMEKALPGMLALSVGGTADSRMADAYVLPGKGAAASLEVLRSVASKPADAADPLRHWKLAGAVLLIALLAAGIFYSWYVFWSAFYEAASRMTFPGGNLSDFF
ncbi:MAG: hypothetical protein HY926_10430 [Elusimicrobia bacterium]|nr:hypothetical protein [Elusimicrobiota bacterium]